MDSVPKGKWFCPECNKNKTRKGKKPPKQKNNTLMTI